MNGPTVSVVMSVYNGARYLRESVESILGQTFGDFEFIVIDDGSTDASGGILAEYAARDARLRIIAQENAGLTRALIRGCAEARGRYIARQDADDWSHPERLGRVVELLESCPRAVMGSSWARYVEEAGEVVETVERPADPDTATRGLLYGRQGPPAHGSVVFRREAYGAAGGYRACFYYGQDADLWLRLARVGWIAYVQDYLYHYRLSAQAISGAFNGIQREFGELGQQCHAARLKGQSEGPYLLQAEGLREHAVQGRARTNGRRRHQAAANYRIGVGLSRRGNPRARHYFWAAIRLAPLHWRSWCRLAAQLLPDGRVFGPSDGPRH